MTNWNALDDGELEFFNQDGDFAMTMHAIPSGFSPKQCAGNPAKILITTMPALDVAAGRLDDGKSGFNEISARQTGAQLARNAQPMHGERFILGFLQTARRAGIQMHELVQQRVERTLGVGVVAQRVGIAQFAADCHLLFLAEVVDYIANLMHLTALDLSAGTGQLADGGVQRLATIQNIQSRHFEIDAAALQILEQLPDYGAVLGGALA